MSHDGPVLEPVRPGDGRSARRARVAAAVVIVAATGVAGLGLLGGSLGRAPVPAPVAVATGRPADAPSTSSVEGPIAQPPAFGSPDPAAPSPTPTLAGGLPSGDPDARVVVFGGSARLVDLARGMTAGAGALVSGPLAGEGDRLVPLGGASWLGLWVGTSWTETEDRRTVEVARLDERGDRGPPILRQMLVGVPAPGSGPGTAVAVSMGVAPDARSAVLASVARRADGTWDVAARVIPLARDGLASDGLPSGGPAPDGAGTGLTLARIPADDTLDEVAPPRVSVSPDGSAVVVETWLFRRGAVERVRWVVDLGPSGLAHARAFGMDDPESLAAYCLRDGWAAPDLFVDLCEPGAEGNGSGDGSIEIRRTALDGSILPRLLSPTPQAAWLGAAIAPSGRIILWDPVAQVLLAIDARTGEPRWTRPPAGEVQPFDPAAAARAGASLRTEGVGPLAISSDGSRAYGVAIRPPAPGDPAFEQRAAGVRAFDLRSMRLMGAWGAPVWLREVQVARDGRVVYALGPGAVDDLGRPARYQPSVVAYDAGSGRVLAVASDLGGPVTFDADP